MSFPRATGILLHPTSLPARGGIGDFGPAAYEFVDFLADARQGLWQVLPLGPPANGNSPYSSTSAFAGNPLLISLERLAEHGWIDRSRLAGLSERVGDIEYDWVQKHKLPLLIEAAGNFLEDAPRGSQVRFQHFCAENAWWLEDFVLFDALRDRYDKARWSQWPRKLACREPDSALREEDGRIHLSGAPDSPPESGGRCARHSEAPKGLLRNATLKHPPEG